MDARTERGSPPAGRLGCQPSTGPHSSVPRVIEVEDAGLGELDDGLLAARAGEGDDDAFAVLVHRHSASLLGLAYHMLGSLLDAEEAVQDALIGAWRRLPEFRGDAAFRTWMYRIVTNQCLTVLRARAPSVPLDAVPEPAAHDARGEPARAAESAAATVALAQALRDLPPGQRACWILRELHGLSYEEIAQVVGENEQTVRGRLFRARRTLVKEMASWR